MTIRITYKPIDEGEFVYHIKIENKNDFNNIEFIKVNSTVSIEPQQNSVI